MSLKILAILFIVFCYTRKSMTIMNNAKNGILVIGESNKVHSQAESILHRDDDRIEVVCSNLTKLGDNRHDEYIIAKLLASNSTTRICSGAAESNYEILDDNKLTSQVRQNINYRLKRAINNNELTTYQKKQLLEKDIATKFLFGDENKVNMFSPPAMDEKPAYDKEVEQEVNEAEEEVKEPTTATNEEIVPKPEEEEEEEEEEEGEAEEEGDGVEADEEHIGKEMTTPETPAPDDEKMPAEVNNSPDSTEHENPDENDSPSVSESVSKTETDYDDENEDSKDETTLPDTDRKEVDIFINKLDHILETSGDYIIAVMLNNYKKRMRMTHVNEKFWNKVREIARKTGKTEMMVKNNLQKKIKSKFGRPFTQEIANTLKTFANAFNLANRRRRIN